MKPGRALTVGAVLVAMLAAGLYVVRHRQLTAYANLSVPVATPAGITMQDRTLDKKASGSTASQVVYADATGMTLYVYGKDTDGKSTCTGDCARTWPPVIAPAGAALVGDWSLVARADRTDQWAYRGSPVYTFAGDKAIGDANGDGTDGVWHAAVFRPETGMILPDGIAVREITNAAGAGLVDSTGMTLYAFDGDAKHPQPSCGDHDDCARQWRPLEAPATAHPMGEFSMIVRDDGITQWAYKGKPLYEFEGDQKPTDVTGAGVDARFYIALTVRYFMPADATIRSNAELGDILTTVTGATLYQRDRVIPGEGHGFRADHGSPALGSAYGTATCDANCAKTWHPFAAPLDARPCGYWDVARRSDGTRQWVYKGFALYTYSGDRPGDVRGNETYELGRIGENRLIGVADDSTVQVGGAAAGVGVGGMFWHAVVP